MSMMHCAGEVRQTLLVCRSKALFVGRAPSAFTSSRRMPSCKRGIAVEVTALPDKRKCPISLPFLSTTTLPWLPYAACGRSVKCLQDHQRIRVASRLAHVMPKRWRAYTYSLRVPFRSLMARRWNVSIMQSACQQRCALHGSSKLLAVSTALITLARD